MKIETLVLMEQFIIDATRLAELIDNYEA